MPVLSPEPIRPTEAESQRARESLRCLAELGPPEEAIVLYLESGEEFSIPAVAFRMMLEILQQMAEGNAVTLIPIDSELTTQQAADLLNVSRPYVVKLLEQKKIPFKKVGRHRRIRLDDLMAFKKQDDAEREQAFEELVAQGQELGLGYDSRCFE